MKEIETRYFIDRQDWRKWLETNFQAKDDIWLEYPLKKTGKERILYNDAVEEALCFGWIDSTIKSLDEENSIQRYSPRNSRSTYSQQNKERVKWLVKHDMIHSSILEKAKEIAAENHVFLKDVIDEIKKTKLHG